MGASLGALVAAHATALTSLDVGGQANHQQASLGEAGLRALVLALPSNTHLRRLDISHNGLGDGFARDVLLPAVRANSSLRELKAFGPASHLLVMAEGIPFMRS